MATVEEELRSEVERLTRELDSVNSKISQSAKYGLGLLEEKLALQSKCEELDNLYENTKHELDITLEVSLSVKVGKFSSEFCCCFLYFLAIWILFWLLFHIMASSNTSETFQPIKPYVKFICKINFNSRCVSIFFPSMTSCPSPFLQTRHNLVICLNYFYSCKIIKRFCPNFLNKKKFNHIS